MRNGRPDFVLAGTGRVTLQAVNPQGGADVDGRFACVATIFEQPIERMFFDMVLRSSCFDRSLTDRGLPSCVWTHDWNTPPIGTTERCEQVGDALEAEGRLFVAEGEDHRAAREVHLAMSARNADGRAPLREFSLGFDIVEARWETPDGEPLNAADDDQEEVLGVYDAELYEFGPTLVGAVNGTGFLRAPESDELLSRFPRPDRPAPATELSADVRRERGLARARLL